MCVWAVHPPAWDHDLVSSPASILHLRQLPLAERSAKERLAALSPQARREYLESVPPEVLADIVRGAWWFERRAKQQPPVGDWLVWIIGSGRGWGKNRVGAETLIDWCEEFPRDVAGNRTEWMVVAETLEDCKKFNFNGPSGLINVLKKRGYIEVQRPPKRGNTTPCYTYLRGPKPQITLYPHGQVIYGDSADDDDVGRGANLAGLWLDELAKWGAMSHDAWYNGLLPALRTDLPGGHPRCIVTTTPKPIGLLKEWYARANAGDQSYRLVIGSTYENAANLSRHTLIELIKELEGTRRGQQELYGHLLDEVEGALWTRANIDQYRVKTIGEMPKLARLTIGVDPAGTGAGDEMGIVVVGQAENYHQFVIADLSKKISGLAGARRAWRTLIDHQHHLAHRHARPIMILEEDYGKKWLTDSMGVVYKTMQKEGLFADYDRPPIKTVKAVELGGKKLRAEPVAMRYEIGMIHHVGVLAGLEDQQCTWDPEDPKAKSPDRVDGLVHASTWLRDQERRHAQTGTALDRTTLPVTRLQP